MEGPLGREYTDDYGRRIYQSNRPGAPPVVMGREFSMPEGSVQQPDMYRDSTQVRDFYVEMLKQAQQSGSRSGVKYYTDAINEIDTALKLQAGDMARGFPANRAPPPEAPYDFEVRQTDGITKHIYPNRR